MERDSHSKSLSLCGTHTVSTQDMLTSTAPVLPALSDYSLHPRHTWPTGPNAQSQSWFAFRTAVSLYVPSHLGSSRSVFVHAGSTCASRAHLAVMATPRTHCHFTKQARALRVPERPSIMLGYELNCEAGASVCEHVGDPLLAQGGSVTFLACALH